MTFPAKMTISPINTGIPLKALSDQVWKGGLDINVYNFENCFSKKGTSAFLLQEHILEIKEINTLNLDKQEKLPYYWSDKGFKNTFVSRALPSLHCTSVTWNYADAVFLSRKYTCFGFVIGLSLILACEEIWRKIYVI